MATSKKKDGFFSNVNDFFRRVGQQDTIKLGDGKVTNLAAPASEDEREKTRELHVFRQFLQAKNWNVKHIELYDEFRRMDKTFPIINAAIRLYAQEICVSGDTMVVTPMGDKTIRELYNKNAKVFYVRSFDKNSGRLDWNMAASVKNNGVKPVVRVTVKRNINEIAAALDTRLIASFKCTPDHKIMVGQDRFIQAQDLKPGDTIWSMFMDKDPSCSCSRQNFNTTTVESVEDAGMEEVFDLVNVAPNHHFIIKLTDTFHLSVHNCTKDTENTVIRIVSEDKRIKKLLEDCFFKNLKLNSTSYHHVRSLVKFGNHFAFIETRKGVGVVDLIHLPPEAIRIMLNPVGERLDDFKYQWFGMGAGIEFEPWEIVHWKNIEDIETEPYGESILRSIVDTYRRIILMREAMIVYRITRAPQRLLFKIDSTGLSADDALRVADEMKKSMYKKPLINPVTGEMDHKYNPVSIEENLYMTTYEGDTSDVRVLEGASNLDAVEDYKIIKDDLFAGLLIPKSYLTFEETLCLRHDTKMLTNDGVMTIKELTEAMNLDGDKKFYALSCNKHGYMTSGKILWANQTKIVDKLYRITVNGKHQIDATDNHPFMMENLNYKRADTLLLGDKLRSMYHYDAIVTGIEIIDLEQPEHVYDIGVEEYHNFALECGIFVHNSNKAALAQEDLRFAGAIRQYQSHYIEGLLHIGLVHLHINGCSKEELDSFEIHMHINSTLAEKTKNELLQQRLDLAKTAWDSGTSGLNLMSYTQVLKELLHFTDEEIAKTIQDQMLEKKIAWRMKRLDEDGFFEDPEPRKKMNGMDKENDLFADLTFESTEIIPSIRAILTEKIEKEIEHLLKPATMRPDPKMIESVMRGEYKNKFEGLVSKNIRLTENDIK